MRQEAEVELEDLWSSAVRVQDMVQGDVDGSSSLAMSMSTVVGKLEVWIDAAGTNGVLWGSHSVLVATVSHFPELDANLKVLGSGCNTGLTKGKVDGLQSRVHAAADLLASHIPSSVAHNPLDSVGE
jgi:hypothetical protein